MPESLLFHDALQRMLMFAGKVHNLRHFCLSNLVGEHSAFADPMLMHVHHDPVCRLVVLVEEAFEHMDHEFHWRVVVVKHQNTIEIWPLGLRSRLGDDRSPRSALIASALAVVVREADRLQFSERAVIRRHCFRLLQFCDPSGTTGRLSAGRRQDTIIDLERLAFQTNDGGADQKTACPPARSAVQPRSRRSLGEKRRIARPVPCVPLWASRRTDFARTMSRAPGAMQNWRHADTHPARSSGRPAAGPEGVFTWMRTPSQAGLRKACKPPWRDPRTTRRAWWTRRQNLRTRP